MAIGGTGMKYRYVVHALIGCVLIYVLMQISPSFSEAARRQQGQDISDNAIIQGSDLNHQVHYDVVLSAYMRGGSTLTGQVLGYHNDSFYVYEPLWKIAQWVYWKGNDTVCRSDRKECRTTSANEIPDSKLTSNASPRINGSLNLAQKILNKIYDCQFTDFERLVLAPFTADFSGPAWISTKQCIDSKGLNSLCVRQNIPSVCENAKHRVTKVLRFTPDHFEMLLRSRPNFKIVHLFRDPRAIMNSRIESKWYPSKYVLSNAEALCQKMIYDYQQGKMLSMKYPDRFRFLYYEDLNNNPLDKVRAIYKYLGMSLDEKKYSTVRTSIGFGSAKNKRLTDREKNTAFWWRKKLSWNIVEQMNAFCKEVYGALGYKTFKTHDQMQNLTFESVKIPREYALI